MDRIFDIWPSTAAFARDLGLPYTTVASWRARGVIPADRDVDVVAAAGARGATLTLEQFHALRREMRQGKRGAA